MEDLGPWMEDIHEWCATHTLQWWLNCFNTQPIIWEDPLVAHDFQVSTWEQYLLWFFVWDLFLPKSPRKKRSTFCRRLVRSQNVESTNLNPPRRKSICHLSTCYSKLRPPSESTLILMLWGFSRTRQTRLNIASMSWRLLVRAAWYPSWIDEVDPLMSSFVSESRIYVFEPSVADLDPSAKFSGPQ